MNVSSGSSRPRVAIVGCGSVGALCAVRLAESGSRVTLVEKRTPGNGSSSRSAACIRAQFGVPETVVGMMYSEWFYNRFHVHMHTPDGDRQPVMASNGYLFLYEDPESNLARAAELTASWKSATANFATQKAVGLDVSLLEPTEIKQRWPHIVTDSLVGATWCPSDGFLFPHMIYGEAVRYARELGVTVRLNTEVIGAKATDGKITALVTTNGEVEADIVINATNAWGSRFSRLVGGMNLPIDPLKRYLYFLEPSPAFLTAFGEDQWKRLPMTIYGMGGGRGVYSRPDGNNLMIGWAHQTDPEPEFTDDDQDRVDPEFNVRTGNSRGHEALMQISEFAPNLADAGRLVVTTSGYYATTPDSIPLIGPDAVLSNLIHAVGCSGHGLMHAPITALLVDAYVYGTVRQGRVLLPNPFNALSIDVHSFDPSRNFSQGHEDMVI